MPLICYESRPMNSLRMSIVHAADAILREYAEAGFDLTLRQLYYQFIARDLFPEKYVDPATGSKNNEKSYNKLGEIINDARMSGLIDWTFITDRTRNVRQNSHWHGAEGILDTCAQQFRLNKWSTQEFYCEVWIEKDALVGVLDQVCPPIDVPYFSCRGYTSQSEMWAAAARLIGKAKEGKTIQIFHLGDHDPSGIDMTRDISDRLSLFVHYHVPAAHLTVERIALNMDQIRVLNPPPSPAKITDSRAARYIDEYGEDSWELDAIDPVALSDLIGKSVFSLLDMEEWYAAEKEENRIKDTLRECAERWNEVDDFLNNR